MKNSFWNRFCEIAESKCVKPHKALKDMNISSGSAYNWKNGTVPNGKILIKMAEYFHISIDDILNQIEMNK